MRYILNCISISVVVAFSCQQSEGCLLRPIASAEKNRAAIGVPIRKQRIDVTLPTPTATLSAKVANEEESDYGTIEQPQEIDVKELEKEFFDKEEVLGRVVSNRTGIYKWNDELFKLMAEKAGVDYSRFSLTLLNSDVVNAEILHHKELEKNHVILYAGLLRKLQKRYGKVKAGHMAFIFGHELGHFKEGHYEDVAKKEGRPDEEEDRRSILLRKYSEAKTFLLRRAFSRRQEELADSRALSWMFELGFDPEEGLEVLGLFKELEDEEKRKEERQKRKGGRKEERGFGIRFDVLSRHPMNDTRLQRGRGIVSDLKLTDINRPPIPRPVDSNGRPIKDWQFKKAHIRPTHIQESVRAQEALFRDRELKGAAFPWQEIYEISKNTKDPKEVAHLILVAQWHFAIHKEKTPVIPYQYWAPGMPGTEEMKKLKKTQWYPEFLKCIKPLIEHFDTLMETDLEGCKTEQDRLQWRFRKWVLSRAMYPLDKTEEEKENSELISLVSENPEMLGGILETIGLLHFDISEVDPVLMDEVLSEASETTSWPVILALFLGERIDLRKALVEWFLREGVLDNITEKETIVDVVKSLRNAALKGGLWDKLSYFLGDNIALWAEENIETREELGRFIRELRAISPEAQKAAYEEIEVPLARLMLEKKGKFSASYNECKVWLIANYEKSKARDELLFMLVEEETGFRKEYYEEPGLERVVGRRCERATDYPKVKFYRYIKAIDDVAPHLDMGWFEVEVARGDTVRYTRFEEYEAKEEKEMERIRRSERAHAGEELEEKVIESNEDYLIRNFLTYDSYFFYAPTSRTHNMARDYLYPYFLHLVKKTSATRPLKKDSRLEHLCNRTKEMLFLNGIFAEQVCSTFGTGVKDMTLWDKDLIWLHNYILNSDTIEPWVYALLCHEPNPFETAYKQGVLTQLLEKIPEGEMRDYLIAKSVLYLYDEYGRREDHSPSGEAAILLSHVRGAGRAQEVAIDIDIERLQESISKARRNILWKVYRDYGLFLQLRRLSGEEMAARRDLEGERPRLAFYPLGYFNDLGALKFCDYVRSDNFAQKDIEGRFREIMSIYRKPSNNRDAELLKYVFNHEAPGFEQFLATDTALEALEALISPTDKFDLGRRIYAERLQQDEEVKKDLAKHIELIKRTHPKNSPAREKAIATLINGGYSETEKAGYVETWQDIDLIEESLAEAGKTTTDEGVLVHSIGVGILERLVKDANVDAMDRVNTVLWLVGLKEKSHFIECCELAYDKDADDYKKESSKLTSYEKERVIKEILSGEKGILRTEDAAAKAEFLNTLFISVFGEARGLKKETLRYFKAVFDTMLYYMDADRAGEVMARFLTSHLEGRDFNELVKLFFESFGFIGIKIAQYLVSNTGIIPDDMKALLMDLTSRVEGPDKRIVFETAKRIYGEEIARKVIKRVKRKLGGGSLMIFYEVELQPRPGVTRSAAIGVLRSDIVKALPEDLVVVNRMIETMQERPEIFGYHTVSMDLMDNLMWQSMVETDLARTVNLQEKMAADIDDFMKRGAAEEGVVISMPHIVMDDFVVKDGQAVVASPNQGPLILMDLAEGETLDLFLKKAEGQGRPGKEKARKVMNTVATLAVHQLTRYGRIHTDLHPGNILVKEEGDEIRINLIDVGLGTEIDRELQQAIQRVIRTMVGYVKVEGEEDLAKIFGDTETFKRALGLGKVSNEQGREWIRTLLSVFQRIANEEWPADKMQLAEERFWQVLSKEGQSFQAKLSETMDIAREVGVSFPRQFYYVMRMFGVMDYIWKGADGARLVQLLKRLTSPAQEERPFKEADKRRISARVCAILRQKGCAVSDNEFKGVLDRAFEAEEIPFFEKIRKLREGLTALLKEKGVDSPDKAEEILVALEKDNILRGEFRIDSIERYIRGAISERRDKEKEERERIEGALGRIPPLEKGKAQETAKMNQFGILARVWKIERLHPGTFIFHRAHKNTPARLYVLTDIFDAKTGEIENFGVAPLQNVYDYYIPGPSELDVLDYEEDYSGKLEEIREEHARETFEDVVVLTRQARDLADKNQGISPPTKEEKEAVAAEKKGKEIEIELSISWLMEWLKNKELDLVDNRFFDEFVKKIGKLMDEDAEWEKNLIVLDIGRCEPFSGLLLAKGETADEYRRFLAGVKSRMDNLGRDAELALQQI